MWVKWQHSKSKKFHWVTERTELAGHFLAPCGQWWAAEWSIIVAHRPNYEQNVCAKCEKWVKKHAKE